jgi:probable HAF family extracellular repeat protein
MKSIGSFILSVWLGVSLVCTGTAAAAPMFRGIGHLPGDAISTAEGVSDDGLTVGGISGTEAIRWQAPFLPVGLGALQGGTSFGLGISGDGAVVVGRSGFTVQSAPIFRATRWTLGGGPESLGTLGGVTGFSQAFAASHDGSVVVGRTGSPQGAPAFRWTEAGGMVGIGDLPGGDVNATAYDVSADGSVIVGRGNSELGAEPFRWTQAGGMVSLGTLGGTGSDSFTWARGVSTDGSIVVGSSPSTAGSEAFLWTASRGMIGLGELPGGFVLSQAYAVSDDASRVIGTSYTDAGQTAFLWDEQNGMRSLKDALIADYGLNIGGWTLSIAQDITPDGNTIVGSGVNPSGRSEGWIITLPEPGTFVLMSIGLAVIGRARPRRRCS